MRRAVREGVIEAGRDGRRRALVMMGYGNVRRGLRGTDGRGTSRFGRLGFSRWKKRSASGVADFAGRAVRRMKTGREAVDFEGCGSSRDVRRGRRRGTVRGTSAGGTSGTLRFEDKEDWSPEGITNIRHRGTKVRRKGQPNVQSFRRDSVRMRKSECCGHPRRKGSGVPDCFRGTYAVREDRLRGTSDSGGRRFNGRSKEAVAFAVFISNQRTASTELKAGQ